MLELLRFNKGEKMSSQVNFDSKSSKVYKPLPIPPKAVTSQGRVCRQVVIQPKEQDVKTQKLVNDYLEASEKVEQLHKQAELIETFKASLEITSAAEEKRKILVAKSQNLAKSQDLLEKEAVKSILPLVLQTTPEILSNFAKEKLDSITCDLKNKNLITSDEGMDQVIIPFIRSQKTQTVNLVLFRDQINDKALAIFLNAVNSPENSVKKIIISKDKIAKLTDVEKILVITLSKKGIVFESK
jgi:hypothetical protein